MNIDWLLVGIVVIIVQPLIWLGIGMLMDWFGDGEDH